jgi:hypothetical protein
MFFYNSSNLWLPLSVTGTRWGLFNSVQYTRHLIFLHSLHSMEAIHTVNFDLGTLKYVLFF